jgi:hypothetical protein
MHLKVSPSHLPSSPPTPSSLSVCIYTGAHRERDRERENTHVQHNNTRHTNPHTSHTHTHSTTRHNTKQQKHSGAAEARGGGATIIILIRSIILFDFTLLSTQRRCGRTGAGPQIEWTRQRSFSLL